MRKGTSYPPRRRRWARRKKAARFPWLPAALVGALAFGYHAADGIPPMPGITAGNASGSASPLVGRASVIDGDTIEIHGERIRLNGIDAPESDQACEDGDGKAYRCGARAADILDRFLKASSPARCDFVERDQYGRFVGDCFRADGASVQAALVRNGWAMDWPGYLPVARAAGRCRSPSRAECRLRHGAPWWGAVGLLPGDGKRRPVVRRGKEAAGKVDPKRNLRSVGRDQP